jgi:uncharacterized protein (DUF1800 family)
MLWDRVRAVSLPLIGCLLLTGAAHAGTFPATTPAEVTAVKNKVLAAQFLARATFGYTEAEVDQLANQITSLGLKQALSQWIDAQAGLPPTLHENLAMQMLAADGFTDLYMSTPPTAPFGQNSYRESSWWNAALTAPDQLRQRMAWALMQICVINQFVGVFGDIAVDASGKPRYLGIVDYYDTLLAGALGNYRTVLGDVTYHPVMGNFLTHRDNKKPDPANNRFPDENYAREIMQLFTIGEVQLWITGEAKRTPDGEFIPTYTNVDIEALARVFTGLRYRSATGAPTGTVNLHDPMAMRFQDHDFNVKVLPTLGLTVPARTATAANGEADINQAVDFLFNHANTGPFIARRLIQRLVKSNPSKSYIKRVATVFNNNGLGVRGDLLAVTKAILLDNEALNSHKFVLVRNGAGQLIGVRVETGSTEDSRLQEPILLYTQFLKLFQAQPIATTNGFRVTVTAADTEEPPYQAPSVFNYYLPDYQPPGFENHSSSSDIPNRQIYGPEFQIFHSVIANRYPNLYRRHLHTNIASTNRLTMSVSFGAGSIETQLATTDQPGLLRRLDLLMCRGSLSDASQAAILSKLNLTTNANERARCAILAVVTSPEYSIEE